MTSTLAFCARYDVGGGRHGIVTVEVGYESPTTLDPWADGQVVKIDDPRLTFVVSAEILERRVQRVEFNVRADTAAWAAIRDAPAGATLDQIGELVLAAPDEPRSDLDITQKDLRAVPVVSMARSWAAVGREFQQALRRFVEERGFDPVAVVLDRPTVTALVREAVTTAGLLDRLASSQDDAIERAMRGFVGLSATARPQRVRPGDGDDLIERVAHEYADAVARGVRAPRRAVAEKFGYHDVHVGRLLAQARTRGLLPVAKPRGRRTKA